MELAQGGLPRIQAFDPLHLPKALQHIWIVEIESALGDDAAEESGIGLGNLPAGGGADEVRLERQRAQEGFGLGAGVAGHADAVAGRARPGQRRQDVGIEVRQHESI